MKPQKSLVFFDIDGTLLDKGHQAPASAVEAIAQLRANGHLAFINTGRCMAMIKQDILDIGFDGVIAACGTHITYGEQTLQNVLLPQDKLLTALDLMLEHHIDFWLEGPENVYIESLQPSEFMEKFIEVFSNWPNIFADIRQSQIMANKFSYQLNDQSRFDLVEPYLQDNFDMIIHHPNIGEVVPRGFSKATGMAFLKQYLGCPDATTFAFGDSLNDLDMLKAADVGIAMGGSRRHLIAHSNHLTDSPAEHGIANALRHYQLIE
jgi:Cof subfamily protein (haloacid dehalogenase superfamily)